MIYWVLTEKTLTEFASGAYPDLDSLEASGRCTTAMSGDLLCVYHSQDTISSRCAIVATESSSIPVPESLGRFRYAALERMKSFLQRAEMLPTVLPRNWHGYHSDNLVTFFAAAQSVASFGPRWVCEVRPEESDDVAFWELTERQERVWLADYVPPVGKYRECRTAWNDGVSEALEHLREANRSIEGYNLADLPGTDVTGGLTYSQWLPRLTAGQKRFLEAPIHESLRLRGPAGSGKTLALAIKAVREIQNVREQGQPGLRILYLTHSWSLSEDVVSIMDGLSEWGRLDEIDVMPLLALAEHFLPTSRAVGNAQLIGDDSLSAKATQLAEIEEVIDEFRAGDWLTFRSMASDGLRARIDSDSVPEARGLAWDCLIEFGCVLGAEGIFPGFDAERRYLKLTRSPWMMPLASDVDKRVVFALYESFFRRLEERNILTSDQMVNDFLNYLETFAWRRRRLSDGYDLIFIDEYHLFNIQERQILKYLNRDPSIYPRLFMALDPRQSPWEVYVGRGSNVQSGIGPRDEEGEAVDLPTVHRSSPEILDLLKHIHLDFPSFDLGSDWDLDIESITSSAESGPKPNVLLCGTADAERRQIFTDLMRAYESMRSGGQIALAIVDQDQFRRYLPLVASLAKTGRTHVSVITGREDVTELKHRKRGIIVGPAEYLAGLQFHTVFVVGIPEMRHGVANQSYRRRQTLSLLYLAISRARRDTRIFANDEWGGLPEVLSKAIEAGICTYTKGPEV